MADFSLCKARRLVLWFYFTSFKAQKGRGYRMKELNYKLEVICIAQPVYTQVK